MSAYVVDRNHIKYLVSAAVAGPDKFHLWHDGKTIFDLDRSDADGLTSLGQMLWDENIKSIEARYPDCVGKPEKMPGRNDEKFIYCHGSGFRVDRFEPVQVIKAAACYAYQSCEHDGWEKSAAKAFCDTLRDKYIRLLAGYEQAEWGAPAEAARSEVKTTVPRSVATPAFLELAEKGGGVKTWANQALARIRPGSTPDMVIGSPETTTERTEDEGRTLVLPIPAGLPKLYACINETGGATLMLAEEY
jgi:hypothetical protein